jgi:hypothetical protein
MNLPEVWNLLEVVTWFVDRGCSSGKGAQSIDSRRRSDV